jgi:hypothetical protein
MFRRMCDKFRIRSINQLPERGSLCMPYANPYAPKYFNPQDQVFLWASVFLIIGLSAFRRKARSSENASSYFSSLQRSLVRLEYFACFTFVAGIVGMLLNAKSFLWVIWEMFFYLSTLVVFYAFPILAIFLTFGILIVRNSLVGFSLFWLAMMVELTNVGLYFAVSRLAQ